PSENNNLAAGNTNIVTRLRAQLNQLLASYPASATASGGNASTSASPEVLENLRVLGYVAYRAPATPNAKLADPKDKLTVFQDVLRATDQIQAGNFAAARSLLSSVQRREPQ